MKAAYRFILFLFAFNAVLVTSVQADSKQLANQLSEITLRLDHASFQTVRRGWSHDYGFRSGTGMLNTFEYLRSLLNYEQLQSQVPMAIFLKGPHSKKALDLQHPQSFGYYNPEFVRYFHATVRHMIGSDNFVHASRGLMKKTGLLEKFERLYHIHQYINENKQEYLRFKADYQKGLAAGNWPEGGYREFLPKHLMDHDLYWNWSETVYYFWIRRDIDGTKELWFAVINDVLDAYNVDKEKIFKRIYKNKNY